MSRGLNVIWVYGFVLTPQGKDCDVAPGVEMTVQGHKPVAYATDSSTVVWSGPLCDLVLPQEKLQTPEVRDYWQEDLARYLHDRGIPPLVPKWLLLIENF